jgi:hypothetical protein
MGVSGDYSFKNGETQENLKAGALGKNTPHGKWG